MLEIPQHMECGSRLIELPDNFCDFADGDRPGATMDGHLQGRFQGSLDHSALKDGWEDSLLSIQDIERGPASTDPTPLM